MGTDLKRSRVYLMFGLVAAILLGLGARFVQLQVVQGEYYEKKGRSVSSSTVSIPAARGEILDRNGNPLVINRQGNSIVVNNAYFPSKTDEQNKVILALVNLMIAQKEEWVDNLPIVFDSKGVPSFAENRESDIKMLKGKTFLNLNDYATAQNCYDALVEMYELSSYSKEDARKIASVRFEMVRLAFSTSTPFTIAEDVSADTVAKVKENSTLYRGATVSVVPYREYVDGNIAPHLLGAMGPISAEEYARLKDKGYKITDEIGKSGIEAAMESELRGTDGKKRVTIDGDGNVTEEIIEEPKQGNTIVLTIDRDLQKAVQASLNTRMPAISTDANGSAVVQQVGTGEILAAANYPTFDISTYRKNYDKLLKTAGQPLYNRYAYSQYAPGSTFKPGMALAALQEGKITEASTIQCTGSYVRDRKFTCMHTHGSISVVTALEKSCNIFFYECANRLGIDTMNKYFKELGLGQPTGVEISETKGTLAGRLERESRGGIWNPGDTWQAGIGQSDNVFTPLQLSTYVTTIANDGTRNEAHFVKSIKSYDCSQTISDKQPTVAAKVSVNPGYFDVVQLGMRKSANEYSAVKSLSPEVCSKTGTAQVRDAKTGKKYTNGFMIAYSPYQSPEISIAVAVERASYGANTAPIVADIHKYYYGDKTNLEKPQAVGELLA